MHTKKPIKIQLIILILVIPALSVFLTLNAPVSSPVERQAFCLDTICTVSIYDMEDMSAKKADETAQRALELCESYDTMLDQRDKDSPIARINSASPSYVTVDSRITELIKKGIYYGELSGGDFDITIGRVSSLWDFHGDRKTLPDDRALKAALKTVDYKNITVSGDRICLGKTGGELDPGGIAKGYIADRLCDYLISQSVTSAIVNLGGNVCVIGRKGNSPFNVGIETPYSDRTETACIIPAADETVVTSGVYERYLEYEGRKYHHVLSPSTGYPVNTDLLSVTVRSHIGNSADCDALSTICLIKGSRAAYELIENMEGFEALLITENGEQLPTSGFFDPPQPAGSPAI